MRQRLVLACFASLTACSTLSACGGSSSETPPPLQPDPKGFHYAAPPVNVSVADSDAGAAPPVTNDLEEDPKPHGPARSTWGSKPAH